jgi:hypothetical protein
VVFSLDPGALHRPLGVTFGAGGDDAAEPLPQGWIGVELPAHRVNEIGGGAGRLGASTAMVLPPPERCGAAGRFAREQLKRSGGLARGLLLARAPASDAQVRLLAEEAARAADVAMDEVVVVARPNEVTLKSSARASARGIIDGMRVSLLGIAAGRPLPRRDAPVVALLLTDASLRPALLERLLNEVAERSFGSVAGLRTPGPDDSLLALATGAVGSDPLELDSLGFRTLKVGAIAVAQSLVRQLLERSAPAGLHETLVVQLTVQGAASDDDAVRATEVLALALGDEAELRRALVAPKTQGDLARRLASLLSHAHVASAKLQSGVVRRPKLLAWQVDLGAGAATATRWTAMEPPTSPS